MKPFSRADSDLVDPMPWARAWPWSRRCRARKTNGMCTGRCDLAPHGWEIPHCLERGMEWVRWVNGEYWSEAPTYESKFKELT